MVRLKPGCTTFLDPELTMMRQVTGVLRWHTVQMAQGTSMIFTLKEEDMKTGLFYDLYM